MKELKEFLTFYGVPFAKKATKEELQELNAKVQSVEGFAEMETIDLLAALGLDLPETPTATIPVVDITEDGTQSTLEFCNLVSNGMTFAEARAFLADKVTSEKVKAVKLQAPRLNLLGLPAGAPDSADGLLEYFRVRNNEQHPDTSEERLVALYKSETEG